MDQSIRSILEESCLAIVHPTTYFDHVTNYTNTINTSHGHSVDASHDARFANYKPFPRGLIASCEKIPFVARDIALSNDL